MHNGALALLWGKPAHDACERVLLAAQRARKPPAAVFPRKGETGKGEIKFLAAAGRFSALPMGCESDDFCKRLVNRPRAVLVLC
jgi:hypothetical protein